MLEVLTGRPQPPSRDRTMECCFVNKQRESELSTSISRASCLRATEFVTAVRESSVAGCCPTQTSLKIEHQLEIRSVRNEQ